MRSLTIMLTAAVLMTAGCLGQEEEASQETFVEIDACELYQITMHWQDDPDVERIIQDLEAEGYRVVTNSEDNYTIVPTFEGILGHMYLDAEAAAVGGADTGAPDDANATQAATNGTQATNEAGARDIIIEVRETGESDSTPSLVETTSADIAEIVTSAMDGEELVHSYETVIEAC